MEIIDKIEYSLKDIKKENIQIPLGWVTPKYTVHALQRINEREKGSLICYPRSLNIILKNVISCKLDAKKRVCEIKYIVSFKKCENMVLILKPRDKWKVTTVYFKIRKR